MNIKMYQIDAFTDTLFKGNPAAVCQLDRRGVAITAKAKHCDIVSRFFVPKLGINEDPVTGALHCALVPLWAKKLGKSQLTAIQASRRGGQLWGEITNDRVFLTGHTKKYMEAVLHL